MKTNHIHIGIVGGGLAGTNLAFQAYLRNVNFTLFDDPKSNTASSVAAGILNPVVLKRMKSVWRGQEFYKHALETYEKFEECFGEKVIEPLPTFRRFSSKQEWNDWTGLQSVAWFNVGLKPPSQELPKPLLGQHGGGLFSLTHRLDVKGFMEVFTGEMKKNDAYVSDRIDVSRLDELKKQHGITHWVLCVGNQFDQNENSEFPGLHKTKGVYIEVKPKEDIRLDAMINAGHFIIPHKDQIWKVGATYGWKAEDLRETKAEVAELEKFLKSELAVKCGLEEVLAGLRPTMKDRKPILGERNGLYHFNGLGSRGVLMAPLLAHWFLDFLEGKSELPSEVNLNRLMG